MKKYLYLIFILAVLVSLWFYEIVHAASYSTSFPGTENPISEGGNWINGAAQGIDWANVETSGNLAWGNQTGGATNDATAILTGTWGATQSAQATVHCANLNPANFQEVEIRLRSTLSSHVNNGYEFDVECGNVPSTQGGSYSAIVRWNGSFNDFTTISNGGNVSFGTSCGVGQNLQCGVVDGDVLSATAVGNTLTLYKNGVMMLTATDSTFAGGNPGIGFYQESGNMVDHAFTSFSTTDGNNTASYPANVTISPKAKIFIGNGANITI